MRRLNYYVVAFGPSVYKTCCEMGEKNNNRSCADRVFSQENKECKEAIWKCCTKKYGSKGMLLCPIDLKELPSYLNFF